ncbi:MAG: transposase [Candidatus Micrarchaeota archaeon]
MKAYKFRIYPSKLDALYRKIQMKNRGEKCGFPRFKSIDRMKSLNYPQAGFKLDKKLEVTPFGEIDIKKHREIQGKIKTLILKRESSGRWFAIFTVEEEIQAPKENNGEKIGIDLGLQNFATLSDGTVIKNPKHLKKHEDKLAKLQKKLSKMLDGICLQIYFATRLKVLVAKSCL